MKEIYKESMIKVPENQTLIVASALCGESFCLGVWGKGLLQCLQINRYNKCKKSVCFCGVPEPMYMYTTK